MQGIVRLINLNRGMIAVEIEDGDYTVVELLGEYEIELGNIISGDLESLGGEEFQNSSKGDTLNVYIQAIHATVVNAKRLLE